MCGITNDGKLLHTVASAPGWEPFEDITTQIGSNWGEFLDVAATDVGGELHLCILAQTAPGEQHILHTVLHTDGTWDRVQDVNTALPTGLPGSFIGIDCAGVGVDLHVCGVTCEGKLWHTIYTQQHNWTPFEDVGALSTNAPGPFTAVTIAEGDTDLHVLAQTGTDLWHTMRSSNPPGWQSTFDNVKTQAGDPGSPSSVDCTGGNSQSHLLHVCCLTDDGKLWHAIRFSNPLVWSNFEEVTNITAAVPGPFKAICIAALVNRVSVFNLDVCTNTEAVVNNLCYTIARSRDAGRKSWLRGQVQSLLVPPCDHIPIPPGCL